MNGIPLTRRQFCHWTGVAAAAMYTAGVSAAPPAEGVLAEALRYRKIDAHNHFDGRRVTVDALLESCDRLGIERTIVSMPLGASPDDVRASNDRVLAAMRQHPDRIIGQCFVNPLFQKEALDELRRCLDEGFCGLGELYTHARLTDPVFEPLIEACIEANASILVHTRADTGLLRSGVPTDAPATTTVSDDFVTVARRYPEALLIHGHIGGGGDWEYMCKVLQACPSVYVDTSGSVTDAGMIDVAKATLGVDRLLFATDTNFETGVGKILAADLTEAERKAMFHDNLNGILRKRGLHAH